jgi:pimeloyl-ACP methyl ester carboxylesterase
MDAGLRVRQGGSGEPVLLLLHGLGATGEVWDGWRPLLARRWPGRWLAPDLPGHGGSRPLPGYTFDTLAAAVAGLASGGARVVVLGHSLGGVVALALGSGRFSVPVQAVIGLGIKVAWTQEELDRAQAAARRPVAWFGSPKRLPPATCASRVWPACWPPTPPPLMRACGRSTGDGGWPWTRARSPSGRRTWRNCWHDRGSR